MVFFINGCMMRNGIVIDSILGVMSSEICRCLLNCVFFSCRYCLMFDSLFVSVVNFFLCWKV